jgi:hypothetical protein
VIIAEGALSETFVDDDSRGLFHNAGEYAVLYPEDAARPACYCAPRLDSGYSVESAKSRLLDRARDLGYIITQKSNVHIEADTNRIDPIQLTSSRLAFVLPEGCSRITLTSHTFVPAQVIPNSRDTRKLGICVRRLLIDGDEVQLGNGGPLHDGWHEAEYENGLLSRRWTFERVPLPAQTRLVLIDLAGEGYYWDDCCSDVVPRRLWARSD